MKRFLAPSAAALVLATASSFSHAAFIDLTSFVALTADDGSGVATVTPNLALLDGVVGFSGLVTNLSSFEWKFTDSSTMDGFANVLVTPLAGSTSLINLADVSTMGFATYTFATPFSGTIKFSVDSHDNTTPAELQLQNVTISAVPEPETFAMLLAGMGLVGFVARRKSGGTGGASAQGARRREEDGAIAA